MSFSSTTLTIGAAGRGGGAFSLLIALRRACRRGDFDMAMCDETGSNSRMFGGFSMLAKLSSWS
jgi:hypothetical protein